MFSCQKSRRLNICTTDQSTFSIHERESKRRTYIPCDELWFVTGRSDQALQPSEIVFPSDCGLTSDWRCHGWESVVTMVVGERQERLAQFLQITRFYTCSSASAFTTCFAQTQTVLRLEMAGVIEHPSIWAPSMCPLALI